MKRAGLRYAVIIHGAELLVPGAVPWVRSKMAVALAGADLLMPVSDYTATKTTGLLERLEQQPPPMARLRARVDLERFRPGLPSDDLRNRLGIPLDAKVILSFGRLVERKGTHRMIEAMAEIRRRVPGAVYVVGGTGPEYKRLRRLTDKLDAPVILAGRVSDADAPALYATADLFALPVVDRWFGLEIEGLGVVLLEAAASETPCLTGRSGGTPEAVIDGETGYVVDAANQAQLVDRAVSVLSDPAAAALMGAAGRRHVAENFSTETPPEALQAWLT